MTKNTTVKRVRPKISIAQALRRRRKNWQLYLMILLPLIQIIIFRYIPMYGLQMAFRNFNPVDGISGSPWVGLDNFARFFNSHIFERVITNTLRISIYTLIAGFPLPIIFALSLNYIKGRRFARIVQTTTFMPHLISTVVMAGIITQFLGLRTGVLNDGIYALFGTRIDFLGSASAFPHMFVWTGIWQNLGQGAIIYIAALAGVDPALHESATMDGASKLQRIRHIDWPSILPTVVILFILNMGNIINVGFERVFLLQNQLNLPASEVIQTYVYQIGLVAPLPQWSLAAAVGFFESIIGLSMILIVNFIARKVSGSGLW